MLKGSFLFKKKISLMYFRKDKISALRVTKRKKENARLL